MKLNKNHLRLSIFLQSIFFVPILISLSIGSDWDSYAIIGTVQNLYLNNTYLPSRPPGFPLYEGFVYLTYFFSKAVGINFEITILISQFLFTIILNFVVFLFFKKEGIRNIYFYFVIIFSPIYLISGFTVIDYFLGSIFGFLSIYVQLHKNDLAKYTPLFLGISVAMRLTNIFFVLAVLILQYRSKVKNKIIFKNLFYFILFSLVLQLPFYSNLWQNTLSESLNSIIDLTCILNLTNTDHSLIDRMGRFIIKQIDFFGIIGSFGIFISIFYLKKENLSKNFHLLVLFILFELSFLRLPTEEGHLLPAFISFILLLSSAKLPKYLVGLILISTIMSNFINISFYSVDKVDGAEEIYFGLSIEEGIFINDLRVRNKIAIEKDFHYENGLFQNTNVWSDGCPN
tara:strand:+ start:2590 stop:3789 length:1200 start_codon:yes stop_codon:yes gene_type:complete